jgi:hypothetical protein
MRFPAPKDFEEFLLGAIELLPKTRRSFDSTLPAPELIPSLDPLGATATRADPLGAEPDYVIESPRFPLSIISESKEREKPSGPGSSSQSIMSGLSLLNPFKTSSPSNDSAVAEISVLISKLEMAQDENEKLKAMCSTVGKLMQSLIVEMQNEIRKGKEAMDEHKIFTALGELKMLRNVLSGDIAWNDFKSIRESDSQ